MAVDDPIPAQFPTIKVEAVPSRPHPLVKLTTAKLKSATPDDYGGLRPGKEGLGVRVSLQGIERAMSLMNALIVTFVARGHTVKPSQDGKMTVVLIYGEEVCFDLTERISRRPHRVTPEEKIEKERSSRKWQKASLSSAWDSTFMRMDIPRWDFFPTGEFTITIHAWGVDGLRRTWLDRPRGRLEDRLPEIIVEIEKYGPALRMMREASEQTARRREEQRQIREEQHRQKEAERIRVEKLEQEVGQWERANRIREYVASVKYFAEAEGWSSSIETWSEWANDVADSLDPIQNIRRNSEKS